MFAAQAHKDQRRKGTDVPYIVHPVGVMLTLQAAGETDPELLAAALEELLKNPEKRQAMGRAAHRRAMDEYSVDAWMRRHLDLYRDVLASRQEKHPV